MALYSISMDGRLEKLETIVEGIIGHLQDFDRQENNYRNSLEQELKYHIERLEDKFVDTQVYWEHSKTQYVCLFLLNQKQETFIELLKYFGFKEEDAKKIYEEIRSNCESESIFPECLKSYNTKHSQPRTVQVGREIGKYLEKFIKVEGLKQHLFSNAKSNYWTHLWDKTFIDHLDNFISYLTENSKSYNIDNNNLPRIVSLLALFKPIKFLGRGGQGYAFECVDLKEIKSYAIKWVPFYETDSLEHSLQEVSILSKIGNESPNIIKYYGIFMNDSDSKESVIKELDGLVPDNLKSQFSMSGISIYSNSQRLEMSPQGSLTNQENVPSNYIFIQVELCKPLNLEDMLENNSTPESRPINQLRSMIQQMLSGVIYYQNKGIIHGDIKPNNIFIGYESDHDIKIGDFGLAIEFKENTNSKTNYYTDRLALVKIFVKLLIIYGTKQEEVFEHILNRRFNEVVVREFILNPELALIKSMLTMDPKTPTNQQILDQYITTIMIYEL